MSASQPAPFDPADPVHVAMLDELSLWSSLSGQMLLEHVPVNVTRALDLGCGAGFPTLELAERLGPSALVLGVDPWRTAMERARAKQRTWSVPQAHFVLADGARLPLRERAFEVVVSNLGVNNFADPGRAFAEVRRVLAPGGLLLLATNLVGHFRELYAELEGVLARERDAAALERLRAHVAHRATLAGLEAMLATHGLRVTATHTHEAALRFRDGSAMLAHHFIRLGFLPAWREVAGERADAVLGALAAALDRRAREPGELRLSVPLAVVVARAD